MLDIEKLWEIAVSGPQKQPYYCMLYSSIISALEAVFCDRISREIVRSDATIDRVFDNHHKFKSWKVPIAEIHKIYRSRNAIVLDHLNSIVWRRTQDVERVYEAALAERFDFRRAWLSEAIEKRHDIVHRNGRTKEGAILAISPHDFVTLHDKAEALVIELDEWVSDRVVVLADADGEFDGVF